MTELNTLVAASTSKKHQAGALLQHHFHRVHDPMFATAAKTRLPLNIFLNCLEDVQEDEDVQLQNNPHYANWELLLAATSFQAGKCHYQTFASYKKKMSIATKLKNWLRQTKLPRIFTSGKEYSSASSPQAKMILTEEK